MNKAVLCGDLTTETYLVCGLHRLLSDCYVIFLGSQYVHKHQIRGYILSKQESCTLLEIIGRHWRGGSVHDLQTRDRRLESSVGLKWCCRIVSLDKALYRLVYSLYPGENRQPISDRDGWCERLVSSAITGSRGCILPRELKCPWNEQVQRPGRLLCKSKEQPWAGYQAINIYL